MEIGLICKDRPGLPVDPIAGFRFVEGTCLIDRSFGIAFC
jgi:hypothetical protein